MIPWQITAAVVMCYLAAGAVTALGYHLHLLRLLRAEPLNLCDYCRFERREIATLYTEFPRETQAAVATICAAAASLIWPLTALVLLFTLGHDSRCRYVRRRPTRPGKGRHAKTTETE